MWNRRRRKIRSSEVTDQIENLLSAEKDELEKRALDERIISSKL